MKAFVLCAGLAATPAALGQIGPDVIIGDLHDVALQGSFGTVRAYAIGTTSCNVGDQELEWFDSGQNDHRHPVIAQNFFRLKDGRLEQIGMSWVKHGFCAVSGNLCDTCGPSQGCDTLGVGCSDPYGSGLNGNRTWLGPRSQINPTTGVFPYPFTAPPFTNDVARRLQVRVNDVDPAQNAGALYFGEGLYITVDEQQWGTDFNNAAYRRMSFNGSFQPSWIGATERETPAIIAWRDHGLGPDQPDNRVKFEVVNVPGDGRFYVAHKAADNGDGTWRYEYAIYNYNSDRAGGGFSVGIGDGVTVTNIGFKDIHHHSGEPYDGADWRGINFGDRVEWIPAQSYNVNPNGNGIYWGTMYNFWFDADAAPSSGPGSLKLFKPGEPGDPNELVLSIDGPGEVDTTCNVDLDGNQEVNVLDLLVFLDGFFDMNADWNNDQTTDILDLLGFLDEYFDGC